MNKQFTPHPVGHIFNPIASPRKKANKFHNTVQISYPSRLNAMAIDPSGISENENMIFTPGEVSIAINLPRLVTIRRFEDGKRAITISQRTLRKGLVKHAALLMKAILCKDISDSWEIDAHMEVEHKHSGLGTSSALICSICAAINELYGNPFTNKELIKYTAQNHGEEIESNDKMIMPVQCIGGSASAGYTEGAICIIAGQSCVVSSVKHESNVIIGIPKNYIPLDGKDLMEAEESQLPKFKKTGEKYRNTIAYRMLHQGLPSISSGNLRGLGELVYDYRFKMGSIQNCSFIYPPMLSIAAQIEKLWHKVPNLEMLSLSSVGPAFFAIGPDLDDVEKVFRNLDLKIIKSELCNKTYQVTIKD